MVTTDPAQQALDKFYDVENLVFIDISMPTWETDIVKAMPDTDNIKPPNPDGSSNGTHYKKHKAAQVTIKGSKYPTTSTTVANVGIQKKSFWGSLSYTKPSFKLDFTKCNNADLTMIRNLIGTDHMTLNNSKQDEAYIRQPLGYQVYKQAGLPSFRCNFASVKVNGTFWGGPEPTDMVKNGPPDMRTPPADGLYVNLESITPQFLKNCFDTTDANIYEIGQWNSASPDDILVERVNAGYLGQESVSKYPNRKDLIIAAQEIAKGLAGSKKVIDWDNYLCYFAMEVLTQNGDGYDANTNNSYICNAPAKDSPNAANGEVKFKFVASGIDSIWGDGTGIGYPSYRSIIAKQVLNDKTELAKLNAMMLKLASDIFGNTNLTKNVNPYVEKAMATLKSAGAQYKQDEVDNVKSRIGQISNWATTQKSVVRS